MRDAAETRADSLTVAVIRHSGHVDERPSSPMAALLVLRFVAELAMLAALAWGGWHISGSAPLSVVTAVVAPVAAALVWGRWVAPRAGHRLPDPARAGVELVLFLVAFVLLTRSEPQPETLVWALAMLLVYLLSMPARRVQV
jgi:Protein of unknown function (DUF2568)